MKKILILIFCFFLASCEDLSGCIFNDDMGEGWIRGQDIVNSYFYKKVEGTYYNVDVKSADGTTTQVQTFASNYPAHNPFGIDKSEYKVVRKFCGAGSVANATDEDIRYTYWTQAGWEAQKDREVRLEVMGGANFCRSLVRKSIRANAWTGVDRDGWKGKGDVQGGWINTGVKVSPNSFVTIELNPPASDGDVGTMFDCTLFDETGEAQGIVYNAEAEFLSINFSKLEKKLINGKWEYITRPNEEEMQRLYDLNRLCGAVGGDANAIEAELLEDSCGTPPSASNSEYDDCETDWTVRQDDYKIVKLYNKEGNQYLVTQTQILPGNYKNTQNTDLEKKCYDASGKLYKLYSDMQLDISKMTDKEKDNLQLLGILNEFKDTVLLTEEEDRESAIDDYFDRDDDGDGENNILLAFANDALTAKTQVADIISRVSIGWQVVNQRTTEVYEFTDFLSRTGPYVEESLQPEDSQYFDQFGQEVNAESCYRSVYDDKITDNGLEFDYWTINRFVKRPRCPTHKSFHRVFKNGPGVWGSVTLDQGCWTGFKAAWSFVRGFWIHLADSRNYKFNRVNLCSPFSDDHYNPDPDNPLKGSIFFVINYSDFLRYKGSNYRWGGVTPWAQYGSRMLWHTDERRVNSETSTANLPGVMYNVDSISNNLCEYKQANDNLNDCNCWRYGGLGMRYIIANENEKIEDADGNEKIKGAALLSNIMRFDPDWDEDRKEEDYTVDYYKDEIFDSAVDSYKKNLRDELYANSLFENDSFNSSGLVTKYMTAGGEVKDLPSPQPYTKHHVVFQDPINYPGENILQRYTFTFQVPADKAGTLFITPGALMKDIDPTVNDKFTFELDLRSAQGGYDMSIMYRNPDCYNPIDQYNEAFGTAQKDGKATDSPEISALFQSAQDYAAKLYQTIEMKIGEPGEAGLTSHIIQYLDTTNSASDISGSAHANQYCTLDDGEYYFSPSGMVRAFYTCNFPGFEEDNKVFFRVQDYEVRKAQNTECNDILFENGQYDVDEKYEDNSGNFIIKYAYSRPAIINVGMIDEYLDKIKTMFGESSIKRIYENYITSGDFQKLMGVILSLYVIIMGMGFVFAIFDIKATFLVKQIFILVGVLALLSPNSWEFFNSYVLQIIYNLPAEITSNFASSFNVGGGAGELLDSPYYILEKILKIILSSSVHAKVLGLFTSPFIVGWLYVYLIYMSFITILRAYGKSILLYCFIFIGMGMFLSMAPIFFIFALFSRTREFFNKWVGVLVSFFFQYIILSLFLIVFGAVVYYMLYGLLQYTVCYETVIRIYQDLGFTELNLDLLRFWRVEGYTGVQAETTSQMLQKINISLNRGPNLFLILSYAAVVNIFEKMVEQVTSYGDTFAGGAGVAASKLSDGAQKAFEAVGGKMSNLLQGGETIGEDGKKTTRLKDAIGRKVTNAKGAIGIRSKAEMKRISQSKGLVKAAIKQGASSAKATGLTGSEAEAATKKSLSKMLAGEVERGAMSQKEASGLLNARSADFAIKNAIYDSHSTLGKAVLNTHRAEPAQNILDADNLRVGKLEGTDNPDERDKINEKFESKRAKILGDAVKYKGSGKAAQQEINAIEKKIKKLAKSQARHYTRKNDDVNYTSSTQDERAKIAQSSVNSRISSANIAKQARALVAAEKGNNIDGARVMAAQEIKESGSQELLNEYTMESLKTIDQRAIDKAARGEFSDDRGKEDYIVQERDNLFNGLGVVEKEKEMLEDWYNKSSKKNI